MEKKTCTNCGFLVDSDRRKCPECFQQNFLPGVAEIENPPRKNITVSKVAREIPVEPITPIDPTISKMDELSALLKSIDKTQKNTESIQRAFFYFLLIETGAVIFHLFMLHLSDLYVDPLACANLGTHCLPDQSLQKFAWGTFGGWTLTAFLKCRQEFKSSSKQ